MRLLYHIEGASTVALPKFDVRDRGLIDGEYRNALRRSRQLERSEEVVYRLHTIPAIGQLRLNAGYNLKF